MPTTTGDIDMSRNIKTFACNVAAAGIAICFADRMLDNFNVVGVNEYVAYGILAVLAACISSVMTLVFGRKRNPFAKLSLGFFSNAMMVVIAIYVSTAYLGCGVVTDSFLYNNGYTKVITDRLDEMGIKHATFFDVAPDPTLACAREGAKAMTDFGPDCIIAVGGGSAMDAGKIMWVLYEHPEADFMDMAMRFADIRKRVYTFPRMGEKAYFIAVPTSAGTGSEVTPFAVITDEKSGVKYPLADYELMPNMAIVDADMMMNAPKGLTAASGIDAVTHALEAYASLMATEFTDAMALRSLRSIFDYLPRAYDDGANDPVAREKMAHAATMAGMAFANAFLGVCPRRRWGPSRSTPTRTRSRATRKSRTTSASREARTKKSSKASSPRYTRSKSASA